MQDHVSRPPRPWHAVWHAVQVFAALTLCVVTSSAHAQNISPKQHERFRIFVTQLRSCGLATDRPLRVSVLGVGDRELRIERHHKELAIHATERGLDAQKDVQIVPVRQISGLVEYRASTDQSFNQEKIQALMRKRPVADAVVTMTFHDKADGKITFGIEAVTLDLSCAVRGDVAISVAKRKYGSDLTALLQRFAHEVLRGSRGPVAILEFQSATRLATDCDTALQARMADAFKVALANTNNVIAGRRRVILGKPAADTRATVIHGRFGTANGSADASSANPSIWIEVSARDRNEAVAVEPRTFVFGNHCNPRPKEFLTTYTHAAPSNNSLLQIYSERGNRFRVGDVFSVQVFSKRAGTLYCWILSSDRTAYILTPNAAAPQAQTITPGATVKFPTGFGFDSWNFEAPSDDVFSCFLPERALPENLADDWNKNWFGKRSGSPKIDIAMIRNLSERMRAQPEMVEGYVRLLIQP